MAATYRSVPSTTLRDSSDVYSLDHGTSSASPLTAYHGSQGLIEYDNLPTISLDNEGFEDITLTAPQRTLSPARPNLGSRFLSTLSTAQAAAAPLARSGSVLHSRAKSWAALVPKLSTNSTSTPDRQRAQQPNKIFGDLFSGESAPVRLGIPTSPSKEKEETDLVMEYQPTFTERPARPSTRRRETAQSVSSIVAPKSATASKSSWFGRKSIASLPATNTPKAQDKFLNLDINEALFPFGPADELSPHAFNDLLLNATSLLQKMQAAYKEKVDYIASIQPEIDAQREESEEAETRSKHLKIQLEDLSKQASEQLKTNKELVEQLSEERMKVHNLQNAPSQTVRLVRRDTDLTDDGEQPYRRKRGSAGSASDSGFESDMETSSLFSATTPSTPLHARLSPSLETDSATWSINSARQRPAPPSRTGTMSPRSPIVPAQIGAKRLGSEGAAWATVEKLRHENNGLRAQVDDMQRSLQGCIDFVGGVTSS